MVHRDIKPSNLLINRSGDIKISGFGVARQQELSQGESESYAGTLNYMAPERIRSQGYSFASDIWSLGLSLLTVALGRFPIKCSGGQFAVLNAITSDSPPTFPVDSSYSIEIRDFLSEVRILFLSLAHE
jgi:mitogen-activated protein kinase kinase 1